MRRVHLSKVGRVWSCVPRGGNMRKTGSNWKRANTGFFPVSISCALIARESTRRNVVFGISWSESKFLYVITNEWEHIDQATLELRPAWDVAISLQLKLCLNVERRPRPRVSNFWKFILLETSEWARIIESGCAPTVWYLGQKMTTRANYENREKLETCWCKSESLVTLFINWFSGHAS